MHYYALLKLIWRNFYQAIKEYFPLFLDPKKKKWTKVISRVHDSAAFRKSVDDASDTTPKRSHAYPPRPRSLPITSNAGSQEDQVTTRNKLNISFPVPKNTKLVNAQDDPVVNVIVKVTPLPNFILIKTAKVWWKNVKFSWNHLKNISWK